MSGEASPIRSIHVSDAGRFGVARLDAREQGVHAFGYVVPNRVIGRVLWQALREAPNVTVAMPAQLKSATLRDDGVLLDVVIEGVTERVRAAVAVAADGAGSVLRASAGIDAAVEDYEQIAHRGECRHRKAPYGRGLRTIHFFGSARGVAGDGRWLRRRMGRDSCARRRTHRARRSRFRRGTAQRVRLARRPLDAHRTPQLLSTRADARRGNRGRDASCSSATPRRRCIRWPARDSISGLRDAATLAEMLASAARRVLISRRPRPSCSKSSPAWRAEDRKGVTRFTDGLVKLFGSDTAGRRTGAQFRPVAVRPESRGQTRAVARELGLRRAHAAAGSRPAARMSIDYDVAVVGAGPIGLATAILIARKAGIPPARVAVFDRRIPDSLDGAKELPVDLRVFALSRASEKILRSRGCLERHRGHARRSLRTHARVARRRSAAWRRRAGVRRRGDGRTQSRCHRRERGVAGGAGGRRASRGYRAHHRRHQRARTGARRRGARGRRTPGACAGS